MFLNKYLGFSVNSLLQLLPSHHFLHFKVEIFNANTAEQPSRTSGMFQGIVGVRAPSALPGPATGLAPGEILSPAGGLDGGLAGGKSFEEVFR